jgi:hypothetical protein
MNPLAVWRYSDEHMEQVAVLYNWLAGDTSAEANAILSAALEHADARCAERIAGILLQRRHESAWGGLVAAYDRLTSEQQRQCQRQAELLKSGIAAALKTKSTPARRNALTLMLDLPCPSLLYAVTDSLRDRQPAIRELAARVFRSTAERFADAADHPPGQRRSGDSAERTALVRALAEALRIYEHHRCPEVLEACLWFAPQLGEPLWEALGPLQGAPARAVTVQLESWNHPRLAPFLLLALGRPAWRHEAQKLLSKWSTRDELLGLLRQSALLSDPSVRDNLHLLRRPVVLAAAGPGLNSVPAPWRALLPFWILYLGFTDEERLRFLSAWVGVTQVELQRGAAYALAALGTPEAMRALRTIAQRESPVARFARWYLVGRNAEMPVPEGQPRADQGVLP